MLPYYDENHFELLRQWRGKPYDKNNPDEYVVNEKLIEAYNVTKNWGNALAMKLYGEAGRERTVRRTIGQWTRKFDQYNWSKVYPSESSPPELAYTVGIDADVGFYVSLDIVDTKVIGPPLRPKFDSIRLSGPTGLHAKMPAQEGLALNFSELVEWSAKEIYKFELSYDEVAERLNLSAIKAQEQVLNHFRNNGDFSKRQPKWPAQTTELFCRLANAVHDAGLDWWFTKSTNRQLRFGRKNGNGNGSVIGRLHLMQKGIQMVWDEIGSLPQLELQDISDDAISSFENSLAADQESWPAKLAAMEDRPGYWPDHYSVAELEPGDELEVDADEPIDIPRSVSADTPPRNIIHYGPPGTGKTFKLLQQLARDYTNAQGRRFAFVTFHQSYGYEEFIEGLRPVLAKPVTAEETMPAPATGSEVQYEIKPGAFLQLCELARKEPKQRFAMVIDEINRGNVSKIFGELISLMEVDKREGGKHPISLTLPYSGNSFSVPWNVDIIGTMNTADRSLALVDTALRRRFEFIETMPDPAVLEDIIVLAGGVAIDVEEMLTMINRRIEAMYDRDHTIGHAYFTQLRYLAPQQQFPALQAIFKNRIIPLLEEYFFEDWQKIRMVLGDNQKSSPDYQFIKEAGKQDDALTLFGRNSQLDQYQFRPRYQLNPPALGQAKAYVEIYARAQTESARTE